METKKWAESQKISFWKVKSESTAHLFHNLKGIVHLEFGPPCQAVTESYYTGGLRRFLHRVCRVQPEYSKKVKRLWSNNAPSHWSQLLNNVLNKNCIASVNQSLYSHNLAPHDCYILEKLHLPMKSMRYVVILAFQREFTDTLQAMEVINLISSFEMFLSRAD